MVRIAGVDLPSQKKKFYIH